MTYPGLTHMRPTLDLLTYDLPWTHSHPTYPGLTHTRLTLDSGYSSPSPFLTPLTSDLPWTALREELRPFQSANPRKGRERGGKKGKNLKAPTPTPGAAHPSYPGPRSLFLFPPLSLVPREGRAAAPGPLRLEAVVTLPLQLNADRAPKSPLPSLSSPYGPSNSVL